MKRKGIRQSREYQEAMRHYLSSDLVIRRHPFIGGDKGDGSDVSGNIKATLRARFRKSSQMRRPK